MSSKSSLGFVAAASVIGSVIEWYDLFVYGSLVVVLSSVFFPAKDPSVSLLSALAAFVAGAAVRPLGGAVFGRIGDRMGRKHAFLLTVVIMGTGATLTGLLPTYASVGVLAPALLVTLRLIQGLALGGEAGGATIYLAEHAPSSSRGAWTSLVQASSVLGLLLSSSMVLLTRVYLGQAAFTNWGWRVPFLFSAVLVMVAVILRLRLRETPLFADLLARKETSKAPIREALGTRANLRPLLVALAVVSGSSVIWHTSQFYSSIFMQTSLKLSVSDATTVTAAALALGAPFFALFGWLSDRVGRKKVILVGNLLCVLLVPIYSTMSAYSKPPDILVLAGLGFLQVFISAMVYGPLGAYLVESFPTRVRYTSFGVAFGVGTGDVGDGTVLIAPALVVATGSIFAGLLWSTAVPLVALAIGIAYMLETKGADLSAERAGV
ncbi:MAG: MFS transporter [Nitrososphaerota archaeon]|nr:MFS transporter [Nitrososphaerota archaeon]